MKILLTGSNGFLGSALLRRLLAHGRRDIRCFVRPGNDTSRIDAMREDYPDAAIETFHGNLVSREDAASCLRDVDVVYHLAATMKGSPAEIFLNTVVTSKNLLEAVHGQIKRIVLISSFGVYGVADLPPGELIDENSPLESRPEKRDVYSHAKWRQEKLFRDHREGNNLPLVIVRPGVIYGPGGGAMSARVGLNLFGLFLHLGDNNPIPLTYVDNCAEAIVIAGNAPDSIGESYNVLDDDLPTAKTYLQRYRREVEKLKYIPVPYALMKWVAGMVERYHRYSKGQLPAIFTPYKTANLWKRHRFSNAKLKSLGWQQIVGTEEGLARTFEYLRSVKTTEPGNQ
jgi:nucleoside-diphosphate-sugar epimerase